MAYNTNLGHTLELIKDQPLGKLKEFLARDYHAAEKSIPGGRGKDDRAEASRLIDYAKVIKGYLWLLDNGTKPGGVGEGELNAFRPIVEALVTKDELNAKILEAFK